MVDRLSMMESAVPAKRIRLEYSSDLISNEENNDFQCYAGTSDVLPGSGSSSSSVGADGSQTCDSGFNELTPPRCLEDDGILAAHSQQPHGVKRPCSGSDDESNSPSPSRCTSFIQPHQQRLHPTSCASSTSEATGCSSSDLSMHCQASTSTAPQPTRPSPPSGYNRNNNKDSSSDGFDHVQGGSSNNSQTNGSNSSQDDDEDEDDDNNSVSSGYSQLSGLSNLDRMDDDDEEEESASGNQPASGSGSTMGPAQWVRNQIRRGQNPRAVLSKVLGGEPSDIPASVSDDFIWRLLVNVLTEGAPRRERLRHLNTIDDAVRLIKNSRRIIVLTGAGVSVSCGIPDFRSRDGIYARLAVDFPNLPDPQAMFDIHFFRKDPRPFFKFAREIYPGQFTPSLCHRFIRSLESHNKLLRNYTQNIDTLEQVAGISNVIQCHGSFASATCQRCKYRVPANAIKDDIFDQRIPMCPHCTPPSSPFPVVGRTGTTPTPPLSPTHGPSPPNNNNDDASSNTTTTTNTNNNFNDATKAVSAGSSSGSDDNVNSDNKASNDCNDDTNMDLNNSGLSSSPFHSHDEDQSSHQPIMKPDIVFFGEGLPDEFHDSIAEDQERCDLLIVIGSSLKVRPVALIPNSIPSEVPQILINREPLNHLTFDIELLGDCDVIINELCHRLSGDWADISVDPGRLSEISDLPPLSPAAASHGTGSSNTKAENADNDSALKESAGASSSSNNIEKVPHPKNEDDIEALRACWAPKVRESVAARLPDNAFFYNGAHRYVFKGAEVYYDPDDVEEDDTASNSSGASELEDVDEHTPAAVVTTSATDAKNDVPSAVVHCPIGPTNGPTTADSFDDIVKAVAALEEEAAVRLEGDKPIAPSCADQESSESSYGSNSSCATLRGDSGRSQSCESTDSGTTNTSSSSSSSCSSNSDDSQPQSRHHRHKSSSVTSDVDALLSSSEHEDHDEVQDWMSLHASLDAQSFDESSQPHAAVVDAVGSLTEGQQQGIMVAEKCSSSGGSVML